MSTYDQALQEAYAASPLEEDELDVSTLEVYNPAYVDDLGNPSPLMVAIGYGDGPGTFFQAYLEPDAPRFAGQLVSFLWVNVKVKRPTIEEGQLPQIDLTFDNVDREIVRRLELAAQDPKTTEVIYRPYMLNDPSGPMMDPPIQMELTVADANVFTVKATAALDNLYNKPCPSEVYSPERFPGLVR